MQFSYRAVSFGGETEAPLLLSSEALQLARNICENTTSQPSGGVAQQLRAEVLGIIPGIHP